MVGWKSSWLFLSHPSPCLCRILGVAKSKIPNALKVNQIFKQYSMLDPGLRKDVNFNNYLELLGLRGSSSHGQRHASSLWEEKDLQHKISKMQVPMYEIKRMMTKAWLHQLQTYFTLRPSMVEEESH